MPGSGRPVHILFCQIPGGSAGMSVCSLPLRSSRRISLSAAASGSLQVFLQTMKRVSSCTRRGSGHIAECFVQTRKITPVNSIVHSIHNIASDTDNIFVIHNIPPAFRTDSGTVRSVCITDGRHLHNLTLYYTPSQNKKTLSERGRISEESLKRKLRKPCYLFTPCRGRVLSQRK